MNYTNACKQCQDYLMAVVNLSLTEGKVIVYPKLMVEIAQRWGFGENRTRKALKFILQAEPKFNAVFTPEVIERIMNV